MATGTLVKDPSTGAFSLAPGAGDNPLGTGKGDPYTAFNQNIASILTQIQNAATTGRQNLGGARDTLQNEAVGAAGPYDPTATPGVNLQNQTGTLGAFAPAVTSINTQLENTNEGIRNLESTIGAIQQANQPMAIGPGESLVTKGGQVLKAGHQYQPQVNPNTGLLDGFDINTGTWASEDRGGMQSSVGTPSGGSGADTAIESIFGKSNPIGAYATDPNYVSEISGLYKTVADSGVTQGVDTLQKYIDNHAKGSPVTAQMIINASSTYGLDPSLLTTVLLHESDFGTAGVATKTNNPGNIGNTGVATQAYNSWQQGVMAAAKNIASRISAVGTNAPTTTQEPSSPVGASFSPEAAQKVQAIPQAYRSYVDSGPLGVAYVNDDRVPANVKQGLQAMASRAGIPYVSAQDVSALKSIQSVLENLGPMQKLADEALSSGVSGRAWDLTVGGLNRAAQSEWGRKLGLFDNYRDVAIKSVQALAGGAGSGLRINGAEIAANTSNLPSSSDNVENATLDIQQLKQLIYTQLSTTFPYAKVEVKDSKGNTGTIPASNLSEAIKRGASVI